MTRPQEQIADEADHPLTDSTADLHALRPRTTAVIDETIRLYPPAYVIGRDTATDLTLDGRTLAAGTRILVSPWLTHRDRRFWPDADTFAPERWLSPHAHGIPRSAYFPFGLGPRGCIGTRLALVEIATTIGTLTRRFQIAPRRNTHQLRADPFITLRPAPGETINIAPRNLPDRR